jgi:5-formyltetrahydrofolate cyclo-ligase
VRAEPEESEKTAWRRRLRAVRREIAADTADRAARSARIWSAIVARAGLDRPAGGRPVRIMLFQGLPTEPDTAGWFEWCAEHGLAAFRPDVDGPDLRVAPGDVDPATLDVVVVPGLGFTPDGRRIGQGGGHYDRFLPRLRPGCLTIGAAFAEQIVADLPVEAHDADVDAVVTDEGPR